MKDVQPPHGQGSLHDLAILAATLLGVLALTDGDVQSAILAVTSLRGLAR